MQRCKANFALQLKGWRENIENFCGSKPPEGGCGSRQAQGFNPLWQPTASVFHGNRRFADCDPIAQFDRFDPRTTIGLPLEAAASSFTVLTEFDTQTKRFPRMKICYLI
ncbi:hypothetical protein KUF71_007159 [Frankliniella fusca]|uniref:Uncharacterized protein n=1 Tax=Frankliniella fusca TaxID=407009 RepID=A0AAE1HA85_9NEOP|nr:hypothetical protein KUF71_007159 [Frankliniella fusca]